MSDNNDLDMGVSPASSTASDERLPADASTPPMPMLESITDPAIEFYEVRGRVEQIHDNVGPSPFTPTAGELGETIITKKIRDQSTNEVADDTRAPAPLAQESDVDSILPPPNDDNETEVIFTSPQREQVSEYPRGSQVTRQSSHQQAGERNDEENDEEVGKEPSSILLIPEAYLVEENSDSDNGPLVWAEPVAPWWKQTRTKVMLGVIFSVVTVASITVGVVLSRGNSSAAVPEVQVVVLPRNTSTPTLSLVPSLHPTMAPSLSLIPSLSPSSSLSFVPSSSPSSCTLKISTNVQELDLVVDDPREPLVAMDRKNMVVYIYDKAPLYNNLIFYSLEEGHQWTVVDVFTIEENVGAGYKVALSGDMAVIGSWASDAQVGVVYVYKRNKFGAWQKEENILPTVGVQGFGGGGGGFGNLVDIDNDLAAVGTYYGSEIFYGHDIYVFHNLHNEWKQVELLHFNNIRGCCIADSTIAIADSFVDRGKPSNNGKFYSTDSIYIYEFNRDTNKLESLQDFMAVAEGAEIVRAVSLSDHHLVYSIGTQRRGGSNYMSSGVFIHHRQGAHQPFALLQRFDLSHFDAGFGGSIAIDRDLLTIGAKNKTHIFLLQDDGYWEESLVLDESYNAYQVSSRSLIATTNPPGGLSEDVGVYSFNLEDCTRLQPMPTQMPSMSAAPTTCNWVEVNIKFNPSLSAGTSWDIAQIGLEGDKVILEKYSADFRETMLAKSLCLEEGTFLFTIYGSNGVASYNLTSYGEVLVSGGDFGASESTSFGVPWQL